VALWVCLLLAVLEFCRLTLNILWLVEPVLEEMALPEAVVLAAIGQEH
jgi:hypothetical protein